MKKLSILFAALIVSVSSIFAAEEVYKTALFGKDYNSKGISAYNETWSSTNEGFTVDIANFNNNNNQWEYIKCGAKKVDSKATITTATAIDIAITKIVVTVDAVTTANVNSTTLTVASDNAFTKDIQTITVAAAKGELAYEVTAPAENMYYKLTFDCKSGSNGIMQISKVEYYKATADIPATAIALDQTTLELEQYKNAKLTATLTPADATTAITWTSSNEAVATVSKGVISALTVGTTTITATAGELTATCALTVKEATVLTCAQAVEIAKTVSANNEVAAGGKYVIRGYVTALVKTPASDFESYGNYSVWMADTKDGGKVFEAYQVVPTDGKTIAAVGDYVEVIGDITKYNTTYETVEKTGTIAVIPEPVKPTTPATWYSQQPIKGTLDGNEVNYSIIYEITRNADKTLTVKMTLNDEAMAVVGMVPQLFIEGAFAGNFNNGEFTTTATYNDGDVLDMYFYMAYAGGATASEHFSYTVGSINDKPNAINNTTLKNNIVKRIENGILIIEKDGIRYNAQGVKLN